MRMLDGERQFIAELKDEGQVVVERSYPGFTVTAVRHPTLGKLVLVQGKDGQGVVVATEE